jgi:hypothetical protein
MAITTRQTDLLVQQDWKKIYQTFQNADFTAYDFETLRKSMIDYLRTYYPEDFNDFIESSEYVALIDLIAFLGQSLAFRADLNARENFLDTAERRDSILKLARLISYNPKRNISSAGVLKFDAIQTTETLFDSQGLNLSNIPVTWNDPGNDNWQEQFFTVLNAAFVDSQVIGKPGGTGTIAGIKTDEYAVNMLPNIVPTFKFEATVNGSLTKFELLSATTAGREYIYEKDPKPTRIFNILYRNDNLGNDSNNTGFFLYFKQGELKTLDFTLTERLPNRVVSVNVDNINNTDIWLYSLDSNGNINELWEKVPAVSGTNVIYNSSTNKNLYQINTRANDQIDLVFGDGALANVPQGSYRAFYRVSNGISYRITPDEMQNIVLPIAYVNRNGRTEQLTIRCSLQSTVTNAQARETLEEIRTKAPQQYYTQNRMITGEDYNILPYTQFSSILKAKATNRSSSGVSRYLDTLDITGKYSSTNIFAQDGLLYRQESVDSVAFTNSASGNLLAVIKDQINNKLLNENNIPFSHFYYEKFSRFTTTDPVINGSLFYAVWIQMSLATGQSKGYLTLKQTYDDSLDAQGNVIDSSVLPLPPLKLSSAASTALRFVTPGSILVFAASNDLTASPKCFDVDNKIKLGLPSVAGDKLYLYATVLSFQDDGTAGGILQPGDEGPVAISVYVPNGAVIKEIIPKIYNEVDDDTLRDAVALINNKKNLGIRYDSVAKLWKIVQPQNLKLTQSDSYLIANPAANAEYDVTYAGDISGLAQDSSWIIAFVNGVNGYTVYYRQLNYVFESSRETKFYFDPRVRVYDTRTGTVLNDQIKILKINSQPDSTSAFFDDRTYFIYKMIVDADGYENSSRILLKFPDVNRDGVPDNPDIFREIVDPTTNTANKYVYFEKTTGLYNFVKYTPIDSTTINTQYQIQGDIERNASLYLDGQIFYATTDDAFYVLSVTVSNGAVSRRAVLSQNYLRYQGRQQLYFQYRHNAPSTRRIDPAPNNIIDLYLLTKVYATDYQAWIQDTSGKVVKPTAANNAELSIEFGALENIKALSDTIIYNPSRFKPLFGAKADPALRATFKVVKNPNVIISDNDVKTTVVAAINRYFDINNWDFGESFYFSELSAYLHNVLLPNISSIIIVPTSAQLGFGNLYQINAEADEILISAATVDNVEVIPAITSSQLGQV